jgi:hypothetical protein
LPECQIDPAAFEKYKPEPTPEQLAEQEAETSRSIDALFRRGVMVRKPETF